MAIGNEDIRWKQRFQNYRRAFELLRSALEDRDIDGFSDLEQEGLIQRFEYTFELGWKTFKDYLAFSDFPLGELTPRRVIKACAASGVFGEAGIDAEAYLEMMLSRNELSHIYDFIRFKQILVKLKEKYLRELEKEYMFFMDKELNDNG